MVSEQRERSASDLQLLIASVPESGIDRLEALIDIDRDERLASCPGLCQQVSAELDAWKQFLPSDRTNRVVALSELFITVAYGHGSWVWGERIINELHNECVSSTLPDDREVALALTRCFGGQPVEPNYDEPIDSEYLQKVGRVYRFGLDMAFRTLPADSQELAQAAAYFLFYIEESFTAARGAALAWFAGDVEADTDADLLIELSHNAMDYFDTSLGRSHPNTVDAVHLYASACRHGKERVELLIEVATAYLALYGSEDKRLFNCLADIAPGRFEAGVYASTHPIDLVHNSAARVLETGGPALESLDNILAAMEPLWVGRTSNISEKLLDTPSIYRNWARWDDV